MPTQASGSPAQMTVLTDRHPPSGHHTHLQMCLPGSDTDTSPPAIHTEPRAHLSTPTGDPHTVSAPAGSQQELLERYGKSQVLC